MVIHLEFAPDAQRALLLDRRMHRELGTSIAELRERVRDVVAFDEARIAALVDQLAGGATFPALAFGLYYDLVIALLGGELGEAERLLGKLADLQPVSRDAVVRGIESPGSSDWSDLYRRKMGLEVPGGVEFGVPSPDVLGEFRERHANAMSMMDRVLPDLAAEVRAIVRDVVCVTGMPGAEFSFQGGSHFQLWGALFLNAQYHDSPLALVEVIAHESAHSLLFGFCTEEPLVFNADEELYPSPLRADPRPMDGIFHATFVSARMHWTMSRLRDSGLLSDSERRFAESALSTDRENFLAGYRVVAEHARMSTFAAELMENARSYMSSAA